MIIQLMSDLHLEMRKKNWREFVQAIDSRDVDVLVLAGDICYAEDAAEVYRAFSEKNLEIVVVPGNHEYYTSSVRLTNKDLREAVKPLANVHLLDGSVVELAGKRFVGATLWFDRQHDTDKYKHWLNDFDLICDFDPWVFEENARHESFLRENVREGDIVVTHYLPSVKSVHPRYDGSPINQFFVHPLDDLIREREPALWLHGHTHEACDYRIEKTRIVCSPLGYPNEAKLSHFEPRKLIEVNA